MKELERQATVSLVVLYFFNELVDGSKVSKRARGTSDAFGSTRIRVPARCIAALLFSLFDALDDDVSSGNSPRPVFFTHEKISAPRRVISEALASHSARIRERPPDVMRFLFRPLKALLSMCRVRSHRQQKEKLFPLLSATVKALTHAHTHVSIIIGSERSLSLFLC